MTGRLAAIAMKTQPRQPMQDLMQANVSLQAGIEGDIRGASPHHQITIVFAGDWREATIGLALDAPWTLRRANLLLEGIDNPRAHGSVLAVGDVLLKITGETTPCSLMEKQLAGLRAALAPDWRGGLTAQVVSAGRIAGRSCLTGGFAEGRRGVG
jgi:MOSC domain-containing protein YiiM